MRGYLRSERAAQVQKCGTGRNRSIVEDGLNYGGLKHESHGQNLIAGQRHGKLRRMGPAQHIVRSQKMTVLTTGGDVLRRSWRAGNTGRVAAVGALARTRHAKAMANQSAGNTSHRNDQCNDKRLNLADQHSYPQRMFQDVASQQNPFSSRKYVNSSSGITEQIQPSSRFKGNPLLVRDMHLPKREKFRSFFEFDVDLRVADDCRLLE
jgi:hypothetical protein